MRSFIRWAGSKRQLVKVLGQYWPGDPAQYVEPFAGSASLFFELEPSQAVLGDLNWELISALRAVRCDVQGVLECLGRLPTGKTAYYRIREIDPRTLSEAEVAARFLYLNRYSFNGLYRTNLKGKFNVPYGPPKSKARMDQATLIRASRLLQNTALVHGDFEGTVAHARSGDLVPHSINTITY